MANTANMTKEQIQDLRKIFEQLVAKLESGENQVTKLITYFNDGVECIDIVTERSSNFTITPVTSKGFSINPDQEHLYTTPNNIRRYDPKVYKKEF